MKLKMIGGGLILVCLSIPAGAAAKDKKNYAESAGTDRARTPATSLKPKPPRGLPTTRRQDRYGLPRRCLPTWRATNGPAG